MTTEFDVLTVKLDSVEKNVDEIKHTVNKLHDNQFEVLVHKDEHEKDIKRLHARIDDECVSKIEFDTLKKPLWVIAVAVLGGIGVWILQIVEKAPEVIKQAQP